MHQEKRFQQSKPRPSWKELESWINTDLDKAEELQREIDKTKDKDKKDELIKAQNLHVKSALANLAILKQRGKFRP